MADPLAGELAAIRERSEAPVAAAGSLPITHPGVRSLMESAADVPLLRAAVEAVLAPHQPGRIVITGLLCRKHQSYRDFSITGPEAQTIRDCPSCGEPFVICAGCVNWTEFTDCPTRNAVAAELLVGEGKPDA